MALSTIPEGTAPSADHITAGLFAPGEITKATPLNIDKQGKGNFSETRRRIKEYFDPTPQTPQQELLRAQMTDPKKVTAEYEKGLPEITDATYDFSAEVLRREYRAMTQYIKDNPSSNLLPWQQSNKWHL